MTRYTAPALYNLSAAQTLVLGTCQHVQATVVYERNTVVYISDEDDYPGAPYREFVV